MAIRKVKGMESEFSIMPNKTINDNLSWAARGLLAYLLSKPADWKVCITSLINETEKSKKHTKRDGVYSLINELIEAGYIQRGRTAGDGYSKTEYTVSSIKDKPLTDKPLTDKPDPVETTLQSKELNKEQSSTNTSVGKKPTTKRQTKPEAFKEFFKCYPSHRKGGTDQTAWNKWKAMKLTDLDAEIALSWIQRANAVQGWSESQYVTGITKFIGEKMWLTPVERVNYEVSTSGDSRSKENSYESAQAGLDKWEQAMLYGDNQQCQDAMGADAGAVQHGMDQETREEPTNRPIITLDAGDWENT